MARIKGNPAGFILALVIVILGAILLVDIWELYDFFDLSEWWEWLFG